jgi:hypothetical protein
MLVALQIVGALLILAPFAAQQFGKLGADEAAYLWPNLIGSGALAVLAAINHQWGFLLLEGVWAAVTARSIIGANRDSGPRGESRVSHTP